MSFSMLLGRVVLPVLGLLIASALAIQTARTGRLELPSFVTSGFRNSTEKPLARRLPLLGPRKVIAEGRVVAYPGAQVVVSTETPGTILRVLVREKSVVRKGDLLVELKADDARSQVDEATAHLNAAEAEVGRVEAEQKRLEALLPRSPAYKEDVERGRFSLLEYRARRDAMKAGRARLVMMLKRHQILAPIDGAITARTAQPGETVAAAAPLVTIVDLSRLRVEAEVDEYDVAHCNPNNPATITSEAFPERSWRGVVEEVADTLVSRQIRPEDPGRPTDTRILPVRIALQESTPLRLGQRVEVEIVGESGDTPPASAPATARPEVPVKPLTAMPNLGNRPIDRMTPR